MARAGPCLVDHPYRGLRAAIGTLHGKEAAIAPVLRRWFDITVEVAPDLDTDALGTFTGEIPRAGTMLEAARAKAYLAIARTGAAFGIGSEGSFGPDARIPLLVSGSELIVLREARSGHEISVHRRTPTNFHHVIVSPHDEIDGFLRHVGFPAHAVIVRTDSAADPGLIIKGLQDRHAVSAAVTRCAARSATGRVMIQTDMRAHLNPTRMAAIARTARWLAVRAARLCPGCSTPGFGLTDVARGLPCGDCGAPTRLIRAEIHGCAQCGHQLRRRERSPRQRSDPTWCEQCNP